MMRVSGCGAAVLLLLGLVSWSRGQETIKALSGRNVTFKADVSARPTEIAWFHGANKIVHLDEGSNTYFYRLKNRTVPNLKEGTLVLMHVSPEDSGSYRAQFLIGSSYSYIHFRLQVFEHVCQVVIQNSTQENNVTLWCTCSAPSANPPTRYQWYSEVSGRHRVSDLKNITIQKEDKEQLLRCNASNEVSWTDAAITVPAREHLARLHIVFICAVVAVILGSIIFIIYKKIPTSPGRNKEEKEKLLPAPTGVSMEDDRAHESAEKDKAPVLVLGAQMKRESLTPSEISFKKAEEILMLIKLQSPVLCLERLILQRDILRIMDVKEEDYAQYMAKVHLGENTTTRTFLCTSTQNGEIGQHDDAETELVHPENGELRMKIPDAENAERIVWSKDGAEMLVVTCSPPAPAGLVLYKGALSTGLVSDGEKTHWDDATRPDGTSVRYFFSLDDVALNSGSVTLYPVIVGTEEKITWTKDGQKLVTWKAGESPENPGADALYLESGRLTLRNLREYGSGQYIMEARGPKTARQEFSLTIQPVPGS